MSSTDALLQAAQQAIRTGQKQQARDLLQQIIQRTPNDYRAWLYLAGVTPSARASLDYVQRAAVLRPNDPIVQQAQAWAEKRLRQEPPPPASAQALPPVGAVREPPSSAPTPVHQPPNPAPSPLPPTQPVRQTLADRPTQPIRPVAAGRPARPITKRITPAPRRQKWGMAAVTAIGLISVLLFLVVGLAWWRTNRPSPVVAEPPLTNQLSDSKQSSLAGSLAIPPSATPTATPLPLEPKNVIAAETPRATWTHTPIPTPTETPTPIPTATPSPFPTLVGNAPIEPWGLRPGEKWIDVNLTSQTLNAYEGSQLAFTSLVSTGTWQFPTVTGQFRVYLRYEAQTMNGYLLGYDYFLTDVPYVMYFYEDYALHGTYWHNNFGTPMSHGCVNLPTPNAEWLYNWSTIGTMVNVHH